MTDISALEVYAGQMSEAASMAVSAAETQRQIVNGNEVTDVPTESGSVPTLAKQAVLAQAKVTASLAEVASQMAGAMTYATTAQGLAGTSNGGYFSVPSASSQEYLILYKNAAGVAEEKARYPSAVAAQRATGLAEAAYAMGVPRPLPDDMPWAVTDEFYQPILGVNAKKGVVHAVLDRLPGLNLIGDYSWVIADANGVVLLGVRWSGEVVGYGLAMTQVSAYTDGPMGAQDVFVLVDDVPYQVTSSGDNFSPVVGAGVLAYMHREGAVSRVNADLPVPGSFAPFITKMWHLLSSGQSLSMGDKTVTTTLQPPAANRLFTLKDGVRLTDQTGTLTADMVAPFKPLTAKVQESPIVQMSAQINRLRGLPSNAGTLTSVHGRNAQTIAQLSKGTVFYSNMMTAVGAAKAECVNKNYAYEVPFVDWIQGEADNAAAPGVYSTSLLQLQSDYQTDIKALCGQPTSVPILLDQISNWTAYNRTFSNVPMEQLQAALQYPERFVCAGPKYWLPTVVDGVHLTTESSMRAGAMHARAAMAIINGERWLPTHATSAVRAGAKVTVKFHTPFGPLVVDTKAVSDPGNWGLRYVDETGEKTIAAVRHIGSNTIELTLSAVPTGVTAFVGIADVGVSGNPGGPTTGARACLRDSSTDKDGYGQPVFNWACHQQITVI